MLKKINNKQILLLGALFLAITSVFSVGYYQFDEHFQILEFAGFKLGMNSVANMPWEFHYQLRSALHPAIVVAFYKLFSFFGFTNPFGIATFFRFLTAAFSFWSSWLLYKAYAPKITSELIKRWFLMLCFLLWFGVFLKVRFSSESWSGMLMVFGFSYYLLNEKSIKWRHFVAGLLFGVAFLFRFQSGFVILGFGLWLIIIEKVKFISLLKFGTGLLLMLAVGVLIDFWYYGEWILTWWNYLMQLFGTSKSFGNDPLWFYFSDSFVKAVPPFSLVFIGSVLLVFVRKPKDMLTWAVLPFLVFHFFIGHKETRFLFSVLGLMPVFVFKALEIISQKKGDALFVGKFAKISIKLFWLSNFIALLVIAVKPADSQISLYKTIYNKYDKPAVLYFVKDNPYDRIKDIYFYKRENLIVSKIDTVSILKNLSNDTIRLFVSKNQSEINALDCKKEMIYSTFPEWVWKINFKHWVERSKMWYVFEVNK